MRKIGGVPTLGAREGQGTNTVIPQVHIYQPRHVLMAPQPNVTAGLHDTYVQTLTDGYFM